MAINIAIIVVSIAIGVCVFYGMYCVSSKKKLEEVLETVVQLEMEFDTLKHTEISIRTEMSVYGSSVSKSNYCVYTNMLTSVNKEMGENVQRRSDILAKLGDVKKTSLNGRLHYRITRCHAREHADELRCEAIRSYVMKMAERPRSSFQGLKALGVELKQLDRETVNFN